MFYNAQATNQHMASDVIGAPVVNNQNEEIGDVNDAVIDPSGKVAALVIGVGGFLGVGEKDAAVSIDSVDVKKDEDKNVVVHVDASKETLEKTAAFESNGPTLSERWDRLQNNMKKGAAEMKKSAQEAAESMQKEMISDSEIKTQ